MSAHTEDLEELHRELNEVRSRRVFQELLGLKGSLHTLHANYRDLDTLLHSLTQTPMSISMTFLRNRDLLYESLLEVARLLHNLVAAVKSLIDHSRRVTRKLLKDNAIAGAVQERIQRDFAENQESQFIQQLREFTQHYQLPVIGFRFGLNNLASDSERAFFIKASQLTKFNWNRHAKQYLSQAGERIDFQSLVDDYLDRIECFYEWFYEQIKEVYSKDLERYQALWERIALLEIEQEIDASLAQDFDPNSDVVSLDDEVFMGVFASLEFDQLLETPPASEERAELAIGLLREMVAVPPRLEAKIHDYYRQQRDLLTDEELKR